MGLEDRFRLRMILPAAGFEMQADSVYRKHETLFQLWVMYGKSLRKSIINALWVEIRMAKYVEIRIEKIAESSMLEAKGERERCTRGALRLRSILPPAGLEDRCALGENQGS